MQGQWRAEVRWCPGRLLDWMPHSQIMVLSSGVWWSTLLWRHNMTSFTFAKQRFGEVCWRSMHIQGRQSSGREAVPSPCRAFVGFPPQTKLQATPNWIMKHYKSVEFLSNFRMSSPSVEKGRGAVKQLRAVETYKKIVTNYVCFYSWTMLTSKIITGIIENHSEFSGCRNSCIRFVSSRSW